MEAVQGKETHRIRVKFRTSNRTRGFFIDNHAYLAPLKGQLNINKILQTSGLSGVVKCTKLEQKTTKEDSYLYYQLSYDPRNFSWPRSLFYLLREWIQHIDRAGIRDRDENPLFTIPPESLQSSLSCIDVYPVVNLLFGSLPDRRSFNAHWEISFEKERDRDFKAQFIHDESQLVLQYTDLDWSQTLRKDSRNHGRRGTGHRTQMQTSPPSTKFSFKVFYKNINRIIVDFHIPKEREYGCNNDPSRKITHITLFLVCTVPMEIRKHQAGRRNDLRITNVCRGRYPKEQPVNNLLSECNIVAVRLQNTKDDDLFSLLSRIAERNPATEIQVARIFTNMQLMPAENRENAFQRRPHGLRKVYVNSKHEQIVNNNCFTNVSDTSYPENLPKEQGRYYEYRKHTHYWSMCRENPDFFGTAYLIEALLGRGCVVKDQLLISQNAFDTFFKEIETQFKKDAERCEWALEDILTKVIESDEAIPILRIFRRYLEKPMDVYIRQKRREIDSGYVRCRKVIVTPTRILPMPAETLMGCRVLRSEGSQKALRIAFREEDGSRMFPATTSAFLIQRRIKEILTKGISLCGTHFQWLGSSNSQYREHGAFFVASDGRDIQEIRQQFGDFTTMESDQKVMSRFGQCFTQSKGADIGIEPWDFETTPDLIGGTDGNGDCYTFSDGVGAMSRAISEKVAQKMRLPRDYVPSAFQFRYRGLKGMLAIDMSLDECNNFIQNLGYRKEHFRKDYKEEDSMLNELRMLDFKFRPSQIKFEGPASREIEVVKLASPSLATLNRPFLSIIDQVSYLQSSKCHKRIVDRIEELLDQHVGDTFRVLIDEQAARDRIKNMPYHFDVERMKLHYGFQLTAEPFFRMILKSTVKYAFSRELSKMQIRLPANRARMMFGVIDETGLLQYGQVFVQYTKNAGIKFPISQAARSVLTGRVKVTKHPCISAGDVRDFEAVNLPQLHHLVDVIVFPHHGPRPHSDEMAGSDLDGDEYVVVWDPRLLFEFNMQPSDYSTPDIYKKGLDEPEDEDEVEEEEDTSALSPDCSPSTANANELLTVGDCGDENTELAQGDCKSIKKISFSKSTISSVHDSPTVSKPRTTLEIIAAEAKCFSNYMLNDTLGTIAISHLSNADRFGLTHPVCEMVARFHSRAVDFPKSGRAPDRLTRDWTSLEDPETYEKIPIPPTKPPFFPDFLDKAHEPSYRSERILGILYRKVQGMIALVELTNDQSDQTDQAAFYRDLHVAGWEHYRRDAEDQLEHYTEELNHIMEQYGVATEAELITGAFLDFRGNNPQKEKDDRSGYTIAETIKMKMTDVWAHFREKFCTNRDGTSFGVYKDLTEYVDRHIHQSEEVDQRYFSSATLEMRRKAVAYYKVCYEKLSDPNNMDVKIYSFAWLMWDILVLIKKDTYYHQKADPMHYVYPIEQQIAKLIETIDAKQLGLKAMKNPLVKLYCRVYEDLLPVLNLLEQWAITKNQILKEIRVEYIALLFIAWSTGRPHGATPPSRLDVLPPGLIGKGNLVSRPIDALKVNPGRYILRFLEFLGSGSFRHFPALDFPAWLGLDFMMFDGQWINLSEAARELVLNLSLNGNPNLLINQTALLPLLVDPMVTKLFTIAVPSARIVPYVVNGKRIEDDEESVELLRDKVLRSFSLKECQMRIRTQGEEFLLLKVFVRGLTSNVKRLLDSRLLNFPIDLEDWDEKDDQRVVYEMMRRLIKKPN